MSIALMTAVWELRISPSHKLVLLALADWANDRGGSCFPSIRRIAERSSIGERQAQRYMRALELGGWVAVVGNRDGGKPGKSRHYQLAADRIYATADERRTGDTSVTRPTNVAEATCTGDKSDTRPTGVAKVTPTGVANDTRSTRSIHHKSSSRNALPAAAATSTDYRKADFGQVGPFRDQTTQNKHLAKARAAGISCQNTATEVRKPNFGGPNLGNTENRSEHGRKRLRTHAPTGAVYWLDDEPAELDTLVEVFGLAEVKKAVAALIDKGTEPLHGRLRAFLLSQRRAQREADAMASRRRDRTAEERAEDARRAKAAMDAYTAARSAPEAPRPRDTRPMEQILREAFGVK